MNVTQRRLLFELVTAQPATFAELSCATHDSTDFLSLALDDLQHRGFINLHNDKYTLQRGVKEHLLNITEVSAVNT